MVALTILDIRYAWLWGLLAFITNYIPNVGFIIGLVPPTIVALLDHDAKTALAVVVIYCVLNIIIQSVIQPRVVGSSVGLSPTLSFLSLIVWAAILGGVGAFLAVPATLFVKALFIDVDPDRRWVTAALQSVRSPRSRAVASAADSTATDTGSSRPRISLSDGSQCLNRRSAAHPARQSAENLGGPQTETGLVTHRPGPEKGPRLMLAEPARNESPR